LEVPSWLIARGEVLIALSTSHGVGIGDKGDNADGGLVNSHWGPMTQSEAPHSGLIQWSSVKLSVSWFCSFARWTLDIRVSPFPRT
jgi:hypothetical protein